METGPKSIKVNMTLKLMQEAVRFIYPLITSMYVIRTLGKQNYGEIQFVRSIISYFTMIAGLGIEGYAVREGAKVRDDRARFQIFSNEIFSISFCSTSMALLLLTIYIAFVRKSGSASSTLYIIGATPIALNVIGRDWINTVYEDFIYVTVRYLFSAVILTCLIFALIREEKDYILYFFLLNAVTCILALLNCIRVQQYSRIGFAALHDFRKHLSPISMIFFSSIASMIYLHSDVTLIGILVNKEAVAVYSVAATLYSMVKQISNSVTSVTIPRLSYYTGIHNAPQFRTLIEKMYDYVLVIVIPSAVGLCAIRNQAMFFIGGSQYEDGGLTLLVLALALPFAVLANIHAQGVILPRRKERVFLRATVISAVLNIGLNFIFLPWLGHLGAALTTLLSEIVIFCILQHESQKYITISIQMRTIITVIMGSILIIVICEVVKYVVYNTILCMFTAIILSVITYFLVLAVRKHAIVDDIKELLHRLLKRHA